MPHDHHEGYGRVGPCPACDLGPFTRNAYWTGKLLLARDFVDEQRYFAEKLRHYTAPAAHLQALDPPPAD